MVGHVHAIAYRARGDVDGGGRVRGILVYGWTGILNCLEGQRVCGGGDLEVF